MSIDLSRTQPVRADQLGLTLRERMWLARAALATMVLSAVSFGVLTTMLPGEAPAPTGVLEHHLAATADAPLPAPLPPPAPVVALPEPTPTPTPEPAAAPAPVPEPEPVVVMVAPKAKPARNVAVSRGKLAATMLPAAPAVDLSKPQPLAAPKQVEPEPVVEEPVMAKPKVEEEPGLKRPAFE